MKLCHLGIVFTATLILASTAMPVPAQGSPRSVLDSNPFRRQRRLRYTDFMMTGRQMEDSQSARFRNTAPGRPRRPRKLDPSPFRGEGSPNRVNELKLRVVNTNTGRQEPYDASKHLNFPTDIRRNAMLDTDVQKAINEAKEKHTGMTEEEEGLKKANMHTMYNGSLYMAQDGGRIQDTHGYLYTHDASDDHRYQHSRSRSHTGRDPVKLLVTDAKGKIALHRQRDPI